MIIKPNYPIRNITSIESSFKRIYGMRSAKLNFDTQTGSFTPGNLLYSKNGVSANIVSITDDGSTGTLYLDNLIGVFQDNEVICESALGSELLTNGGFDSDTVGWDVSNCTLASISGGQAGNCLEITRVGSSNQYTKQDISFDNNSFYEFSVYLKSGTSGNEKFWIQLGEYYVANIAYVEGITSNAWVKNTLRCLASTADMVGLFKRTSTEGTMLFDTASCKQITNAALANGVLY